MSYALTEIDQARIRGDACSAVAGSIIIVAGHRIDWWRTADSKTIKHDLSPDQPPREFHLQGVRP